LVPEVFVSPLPCIKEESFTSSSPRHQSSYVLKFIRTWHTFCPCRSRLLAQAIPGKPLDPRLLDWTVATLGAAVLS
jgi:hypothetical protein